MATTQQHPDLGKPQAGWRLQVYTIIFEADKPDRRCTVSDTLFNAAQP